MIDFDSNRCCNVLGGTLTKFFYLCVQACRTLKFPGGLVKLTLDRICKCVEDELFVIDITNTKYFSICLTVDGDDLGANIILDKYDDPRSSDGEYHPALGIDLIEEVTPDTLDDVKSICRVANHLGKTEFNYLVSNGLPVSAIPSVCCCAGYLTKIASILTDIAANFIIDAYLMRTATKQDFGKPEFLRMQIGMFSNTFIRELCMTNVMMFGGSDSGFILSVKSYVRPDEDCPNQPDKYETVVSLDNISFEFVDRKTLLESRSILFE